MTDLLITNAALLDVETGSLHDGSSVRISGDRISEVALGRRLDRVEGDHVVDADGKTLMPGLIDAHVHTSVTTLDLGRVGPATGHAGRHRDQTGAGGHGAQGLHHRAVCAGRSCAACAGATWR